MRLSEVFSQRIHTQLRGAVGVAGQGLSESSATLGRPSAQAGETRHFADAGARPVAMPPGRPRTANPSKRISVVERGHRGMDWLGEDAAAVTPAVFIAGDRQHVGRRYIPFGQLPTAR
jgi:hypothetical protein